VSADGEGARNEWNARSIYLLASLTLIGSLNFLDRGLLGLLLPLIKEDLVISDTMLGIVSGLAFVLFYSTVGVPIAWLADRYSRRNIITIGLSVWSLMTALTGFVSNVWQLAATRFLLGAGEASSMGPSNSIVSDLFTGKNRPLAIAILGSASSIAALVFVPIAGWISIEYGWRAVFIACGAPGLVLAAIFFLTNREPPRKGEAAQIKPTFTETLYYLGRSRAFVMVTVAECLLAINLYATTVWTSSFLVRVHGLDMMAISATLGPLKGLAGLTGALLVGWIASRLGQRNLRWGLWVPALAMAIIMPGEVMYLFGSSLWVALAGFGLAAMMTAGQQPPVFAVIMNLAQPRMRAMAIAVMLLFSGLVGQIVGPLTVGVLNDLLHTAHGEEAIRYSLAICSVSVVLASLALFYGASDPMMRKASAAAAVE